MNMEEIVTEAAKEDDEALTAKRKTDEEEGPWLADDNFAVWVASHPHDTKKVICETQEFKDLTFCADPE